METQNCAADFKDASGGYSMPVADLSISEAKNMFDLNVWSYVTMTQAFLPLLRNYKTGALIVNHTSAGSMITLPFNGAYSASKAASAMLSEALRLELQPFGIKVVDLKTVGSFLASKAT
jgi:1-acylglycerone phosphate reductase